MTDYGKPFWWWCAKSGRGVGEVPCCVRCIPVFERIPEGERPEAAEPDDETVCIAGRSIYSEAVGCFASRPRAWSPKRFGHARVMRRIPSLADAVLWVAEGVLP